MPYNPAIDHLAVVTRIRAEFPPSSTPEMSLTICNRVAHALRGLGEDAGLLEKSTGNQVNNRAIDIIAYPDGRSFDCLINAEATADPAWQDKGIGDPSRYREPFPIGPVPEPPDPEPEPEPPPDDEVLLMLAALVQGQEEVLDVLRDSQEAILAELRGIRARLDQPFTVRVRF